MTQGRSGIFIEIASVALLPRNDTGLGILDLVLGILEFPKSLDFLPHSAGWSVHKLHAKLTKLASNAIS